MPLFVPQNTNSSLVLFPDIFFLLFSNSNLKFQLLVNNVFDLNYENNGYFYSYDIEDNGAVTTFYGNAYYPQAGRNYMLGMSLRF